MQTMVIRKKNSGISSAKANHLYWMGRYAERVFLALHMLKKHYDLMIDEDSEAYSNFCLRMGVENKYSSAEQFIDSYLFDESNNDSIINMLNRLKDNAILLREEITTETLSYIEMSINFMKTAKAEGKTFCDMQTITDYMLAFWGSVEERVWTPTVRRTIKFGKFVECADIQVRFGYDLTRIMNLYHRIKECVESDEDMYDEIKFLAFESQLEPDTYNKPTTLNYLNGIFTA